MFLDNLIQFSASQAITSTAASTNLYDVTGAGSGNATGMTAGLTGSGSTAVIGFDIGAGDGIAIPEIFWNVNTSFVSGGGATLTIQLQAAVDNGSNAPGTWVTLTQTQAFAASGLAAGVNGQFQVPPVPPGFGEAQPRFYRLNYSVATSTFSAGAISANLLLNLAQATKLQNYPANYIA